MEWIFLKRHSALYFSPHSRDFPAAWRFFAPKTAGEFMGSDPLTSREARMCSYYNELKERKWTRHL